MTVRKTDPDSTGDPEAAVHPRVSSQMGGQPPKGLPEAAPDTGIMVERHKLTTVAAAAGVPVQ